MRNFVDIESEYLRECGNVGRLEKLKYNSNTYDEEAGETKKEALVYLPYGYDTEEIGDYPVVFLMHGGGCDQEDLFGGLEAKTDLKNILDHMIAAKKCKPMVVVTPTFYFEGTEEALTSTKDARLLTENFHQELLRDLLPAVESSYRVRKDREARAFGGFSMGSEATWNVFAKCLKEFKYFLPMCGDYWVVKLKGGLECPVETVDYLEKAAREEQYDFRVVACVGDKDIAYEPMDSLIREMRNRKDVFRFEGEDSEWNVLYYVRPEGIHTREYVHEYVRNGLPLFF